MANLIKWRRGCRAGLIQAVRSEVGRSPAYAPGRGRGLNWPLPPLDVEHAPVYLAEGALPALIGVYEEFVDRYLVAHDFSAPPRRWLHDSIPADEGVLDHVFPLLGSVMGVAAEILLIRLVWLIQQYPGLQTVSTPTELSVLTTAGWVGVRDGQVLYRFGTEPVLINALPGPSLSVGHIRVFSKGLNGIYRKLSLAGQLAMVQLATRMRPKPLLREFYDDGLITGGALGTRRTVSDRILSMEQALARSEHPTETLQAILVPEFLSVTEYRTLFDIPWKKEDRAKVLSNQLIRKLPLVQKILEAA